MQTRPRAQGHNGSAIKHFPSADKINSELLDRVRRAVRVRNYSIRTVQELLGHKDVRTTQIYTHVTQDGPQAVRTPLSQVRARQRRQKVENVLEILAGAFGRLRARIGELNRGDAGAWGEAVT